MLAGLLGYGGAGNADVLVTLNPETELKSLNYRLGDIAAVVADDVRLQTELSNLIVGKAPRPGYTGYVTRHELSALIERAMPNLYLQLDWSGPGRARLTSIGSLFPGSHIQQAAYDRIYEYLGERYEDFSIGLADNETISPVLPSGEVSITANLPDTALNKRMAVWVDAHVNGSLYQSIPVWFSVSVYQEVLAASRTLDRHDIPRESDFVRVVEDIASLQGEPVDSMEALQGMRLKQPLREGALLSSAMLEIQPLVVRGQEVKVYASAGKVSLSTKAIALHDGRMLQKISVRPPESGLSYAATVIGQGRVRVY
jgi:flagella basal body P-ring formation protein FlgA